MIAPRRFLVFAMAALASCSAVPKDASRDQVARADPDAVRAPGRDAASGAAIDSTGAVMQVTIPGSGVAFSMVYVHGGTAMIGTPAGAPLRGEDEPEPTDVTLSAFWIGQYEVTFDEFAVFRFRDRDSDSTAAGEGFDADAVARPSPPYEDPSAGLSGSGLPATGMTQWGALHYARWLWEKTGDFYRLPTEAEWEHACRLGGERPLETYAWYLDNSAEALHEVGTKSADDLGLFDMLGNASEWTLDQYRADYGAFLREQPIDPWVQPTSMHPRTVRGGAFDDGPDDLRCGDRLESSLAWKRRDPQIPKSFWWNTDSAFLGFRLVRPAAQPTRQEAAAFFSTVLGD